jgi:hypothetical protein
MKKTLVALALCLVGCGVPSYTWHISEKGPQDICYQGQYPVVLHNTTTIEVLSHMSNGRSSIRVTSGPYTNNILICPTTMIVPR